MAAKRPPNSNTATQKINTGGQLGSWAFGRTGTSSVTGGPGGASNIAVTVRCAREGVRKTEALEHLLALVSLRRVPPEKAETWAWKSSSSSS